MIMEDLVDSGDDSKIGDSNSISSCSTSSPSFTVSESESNNEIAVNQLPRKRVRTRGGLAIRLTRNPTTTASITPSIDLQRDDSIDTLRHHVMNLKNTLPTAPIVDPTTSVNQWKNQPNVVEQSNFMGVPGLKVNMDSKKPIDFFKLFVTDELINTIVLETSKYAEHEINKHRPLKRSSRLKDWKAITADDMRNFLGIILHMGCVKLPSFEHYCSNNKLYGFPVFSKVML